MSCMVKICGINSEDALIAAMSAGADALGYVFFPPSPRHISLKGATTLTKQVPNSILKVGLFVEAGDEALQTAIEAGNLDVIQLHGKESPERVTEVKLRFGLKVMKAISVSTADDIDKAQSDYDGIADFLLFDAKPPKDSVLPGGNAVSFDWTLLTGRHFKSDWMLAGGLNPDNVAEAIKISGAPWADVSSGVEKTKGVKDARKIADFIHAAKGY
ncbi:phosphoribosylanthranilate isomerase [Thalassospira lucentensis]|uniref:phosphoribosylanthranilate isomerase n=1 Tax=Thalassospira lucentensis TaxID=168935 RepID=UPI0003B55560|nr:phosphoribosylanthranilate isomerase [Thalassospira lucentensis]RCK26990.1 N-(5'-phosphoribosyl)anthranilate isomerase [Thalassospira lucentensis MCCC 1A00383 = DSM 14000]